MVALNFNARSVTPNTSPEAIPSGIYDAIITSTTEKPTKNRDGFFTEIELRIQGGDFNGRKVLDRLNLKNKSTSAVEIAYGTLSAICHVTGRLDITDTNQLCGVPLKISVTKEPRDDRPGQYSNSVTGYFDINGNAPGAAAPGAAAPGGGMQQGGAPVPSWAGNQQQPQQQMQQQPQQQPAQYQGQPQYQEQAPQYQPQQQQGQPQYQGQQAAATQYGGQPQFDPNQQPMQGQAQYQAQPQQQAPQYQVQPQQQQPQQQQPQYQAQPQHGQYPQQQQNPNATGPAASGDVPAWVTGQ